MPEINYANKSQTAPYDAAKWNAQDANEVKTSVNSLYNSNLLKKRELISRIYQTGTNDPIIDNNNRYYDNLANIDDPSNPKWVSIELERISVGEYKLLILAYAATNFINTSRVDMTFGDKLMRRGTISESTTGGVQTVTIPFYSYSMQGDLADGVISNPSTTIFITIYD